jgi:hypothetical protein
VGGGLALHAATTLSFTADAVWNLDRDKGGGKPRYGGGAEYFITGADAQAGYPLRLGGVYDSFDKTGYVTGGLGFASVSLGLDLSIRQQVSGEGDDFAFLAGLRLFGPSSGT